MSDSDKPGAPDIVRPTQQRRFLPAFGRAAFLLGGGSLLLSCLSGILIRSTQEGPNADPTATGIFAIAAAIVVVTCAAAGVVFGVLSLFGLGKVDGTSRPVLGVIGLLAGALMCTLLVAAFISVAAIRARIDAQNQARLASESWPFVDQTAALTFERPGDTWILRTGEQAKELNPLAIAIAYDSSDAPGHERLVTILSEELAGIDASQIDLLALGQSLAESSGLENRTIESVELVSVDGKPAVRYVVSGDAGGMPGRQFAAAVLHENRCVQFHLAGEANDPNLTETEFTFLLAKVVLRYPPAP